jgi:radical SAM protein with 4Fe4S-binding SPASM domain
MFAGEGEPLLHKDLPLFVATAREAGIDVSITTNGSLGRYELWQDVLPHLTWLRFSLDAGDDITYARVHGVSSIVYAQALQSISDAVRVKQELGLKATVGVQFLVLPENENSVEAAILTLQGLGVDYLTLKSYSRHPKMLKDKEVVYQQEIIEQLAEVAQKHQESSRMAIVFRRESMLAYTAQEKKFTHCRALPFGGYICANGDFYSCSTFIGDSRFLAGNLNEQDMQEILYGSSRRASVELGLNALQINEECRFNCRMARVNEFLEILAHEPEHINFI